MARFCIFCGQRPVEKTNEHVIPQWLINLTGDPKRYINVGQFYNRISASPEGSIPRIPFDQLTFPACAVCNKEFSHLEDRACQVIQRMIALAPLGADDVDTLLDWLDKVRIGLWLGMQMFDDNPFDVRPNFYIKERLGSADRAVMVWVHAERVPGVNWIGADTPTFALMPSCFALRIQNLFMLSVSSPFVVSQELGLAYPERIEYADPELIVKLVAGSETLNGPLLPFIRAGRGTVLAQSIVPGLRGSDPLDHWYDGDYAKALFPIEQRSSVFLGRGHSVSTYPDYPSRAWIPAQPPEGNIFVTAHIETFRSQLHLFALQSISETITDDRREQIRGIWQDCITGTRRVLSNVVRQHLVRDAPVGRNSPCPCGSGIKYKVCCGDPSLNR